MIIHWHWGYPAVFASPHGFPAGMYTAKKRRWDVIFTVRTAPRLNLCWIDKISRDQIKKNLWPERFFFDMLLMERLYMGFSGDFLDNQFNPISISG